jgi:hypothetical protein
METAEKSNLLNALKSGVVTVTFKKIDSDEIRIMPCTINEQTLVDAGVKPMVKDIDLDTEHFAAWAIDKEAWRSFRLDTVIGWALGNVSAAS